MNAICQLTFKVYNIIDIPISLKVFDPDIIYIIDLGKNLYCFKSHKKDIHYYEKGSYYKIGDFYYTGYYTNPLKYWLNKKCLYEQIYLF